MKKIAVIGAGIGGMAAAHDLARAGNHVTMYEAADYVGGLAAGFKEPHWSWSAEKYYHHWFQSDQHILGLIDELGLSERVIFPRPYTVMYHKERFYPFDSILNALLFPGLGWGIDKIRFGLVGLYLRLTNNWRGLEKVTVDSWMRKWAGDTVYELMWEPLMLGKFGDRYAEQVNMAWMWARLKARTTRLGTYQGGFQALADELAERLQEMGVDFHLASPIESIQQGEDKSLNLFSSRGVEAYDYCLATVSPALMSEITPMLPDSYLAGLHNLKSMGAVVLILALANQLSEEGYYWYNMPKSAGFPYLALVEHTNYLSPQYFGGDHIVYVGDYLEADHEYFQLNKDELLERFLPSFHRINQKFSPDWVRKTWLFRTNYAQPVPLVNHSENIPDIRTPVAGLYYASMSQVYPWDRGTNFAVEIGRRSASMILTEVSG